jgi:hypothetical protein
METESRSVRIAATLEAQFQSCHTLLNETLTQISKQGQAELWELRNAMSLMKTAAQLAAASTGSSESAPQKISKIAVQFSNNVG